MRYLVVLVRFRMPLRTLSNIRALVPVDTCGVVHCWLLVLRTVALVVVWIVLLVAMDALASRIEGSIINERNLRKITLVECNKTTKISICDNMVLSSGPDNLVWIAGELIRGASMVRCPNSLGALVVIADTSIVITAADFAAFTKEISFNLRLILSLGLRRQCTSCCLAVFHFGHDKFLCVDDQRDVKICGSSSRKILFLCIEKIS